MKPFLKIFFLSQIYFSPISGMCQFNLPWPDYTYLGFEDTLNYSHLSFDSISNPTNIWQIGIPQKTVFTYCIEQRAIMTDTVNSYPINDTSSFIIEHIVTTGFMNSDQYSVISGNYFVDSDSLDDFGKIEFSPDNGISWVLISEDTLSYLPEDGGAITTWPAYYSYFPTLTGASGTLKPFTIELSGIGYIFNLNYDDTVLFRFSFISDGISESRDGLMFDYIEIFDMFIEGVGENKIEFMNVYPNPASTEIQIQNINTPIENFKIYAIDDRLIFTQNNPNQNNIPIDFLENGTYQILVETNDGKFIKSRFIKL